MSERMSLRMSVSICLLDIIITSNMSRKTHAHSLSGLMADLQTVCQMGCQYNMCVKSFSKDAMQDVGNKTRFYAKENVLYICQIKCQNKGQEECMSVE